MKRTRQGNIQKEQESHRKVAKQAKNKVLGMQFDIGSLLKEMCKVLQYNN